MTILLRLPDPRNTLAKNNHALLQSYVAAEDDTTLTIVLPSPGLDWYLPHPMPNWNTGFYFVSQSETGCVLGYTTPCPPGGGEVLVAIFH
jgi:hypothetical protein